MARPSKGKISQTNLKLPADLKEWASQQAAEDFQTISGFISKLIKEEKIRRESAKPSV